MTLTWTNLRVTYSVRNVGGTVSYYLGQTEIGRTDGNRKDGRKSERSTYRGDAHLKKHRTNKPELIDCDTMVNLPILYIHQHTKSMLTSIFINY